MGSGRIRGAIALAATVVATFTFAGSASAETFNANAGTLGAIPDGTAAAPPAFGAPLNITFNVSDLEAPLVNVALTITGTHPCTSPFSGNVKKGKHTVSVTATDSAGNASAAATATWTVKRKKPRR